MPVSKARAVALKHGFKSGLEETVAKQLEDAGMPVAYEEVVIPYVTPVTPHKYHVDFKLPNGIHIETKGRFLLADRKKHLLVKAQHPHIDIRFVFTRSKSPISKGSKTTYSDWCLKNGFLYSDKTIPVSWLTEKPTIRKTI